MATHVIYIPGLGDQRRFLLWVQRQLLRTWRIYGMKTELFTMRWAEKDGFDERFSQLLARVDELADLHAHVILVGASAGASTALTAYAKKKKVVLGMVAVCGQLRGVKKVPSPALMLNPRFEVSLKAMEQAQKTLKRGDRQRILTLRPRIDAVVQPEEAILEGALNVRMNVWGHALGIGYALAYEGWRVRRLVRQGQRR